MWSFFKFGQGPAPRNIALPIQLSKQELFERIASKTVKKIPMFSIGRLSKFVGQVNDDGFQIVMYSNAKQKTLKPIILIPVNVNGIIPNPKTNEIQIEITIVKAQMTLLRSANFILCLWWPLWTLSTLIAYPYLLKQDGTIFTSSIMMPLGVIIVPFLWLELKKSPERSLDYAEKYLFDLFKT